MESVTPTLINRQGNQERCGFSCVSLRMSAIRPSSGSERAFIFRIRLVRCTFTVDSAIPISWAICLLKSAGSGLDHDLALTGAKRVETFPEHSQRLFALLTGTIASQTSFDCIEKVLITERFREELYRPPFIACTVIGISPCAVMKTIGSCLFAAASSLKPRPLSPGNLTSRGRSGRQCGDRH